MAKHKRTVEPLLSVAQVQELTGYSRNGLAKMVREGRFPEPRDLGGVGHKLAWKASAVTEWIESRPPASSPVWSRQTEQA